VAVTIGSNIASLQAQRKLADAITSLSSVFERLSSGQRINRASDDAAGLAISQSLNSDVRVWNQAVKNVNDGLSLINVAEGALSSLSGISQRQLELATQAANGTYSITQRQAMNTEANALVDEYNRIIGSTKFNGQNLFDPSIGTITIQAGYGSTSGVLGINLSDQLPRAVGDGTFQTATSYQATDPGNRSIVSGDVNGDGKLDLITASYFGGEVTLLIGNGDGSFQASTSIASGINLTGVTVADLNGDNKLDIITSDCTGFASVILGNGNGTFQAAQTVTMTGWPWSVITGDFNGDGKLDLVTSDYGDGNLSIALGNGNGTFQKAASYVAGSNTYVTAGDVNGDGKLDLVSANYGSSTVSVLLGNGDGSFVAAHSFHSGGSIPKNVKLGDINGDGRLDIVTADYSGGDVSLLIGNGDGSFSSAQTLQTGGSLPTSVTLGDLNGDGRLDIIATNYASLTIAVFLGNGNGTFQSRSTSSTIGSAFSLVLGDFNGDGRPDMATSTTGRNLDVFLANGGDTADTTYLNINTQQGARDALGTITTNLTRIQSQLSSIGATTSRLMVALNNLKSGSLNTAAASARITDTDIAQESANLTKNTILRQVAASVLAQANQQPEIAFSLLKGG